MAHVLLVEDDTDYREIVRDLLQIGGHEVTVTSNGEEALVLLHRGHRPSLILLDMMMPRMDGRQFLTHLLQEPELRAIPVVIISGGYRDVPPPARVTLTKPLDLEVLLDVVAAF